MQVEDFKVSPAEQNIDFLNNSAQFGQRQCSCSQRASPLELQNAGLVYDMPAQEIEVSKQ